LATIPAVIVFLLCSWFAILVMRQYRRKRKTSHFFWGVSLGFSALASLFYCITLWAMPHNALTFYAYYVLGAMWMPSLMGLGSLALVYRRQWVLGVAGVVGVIGLIGTFLMMGASHSNTALQGLDGGAGTGIIQTGLWLVPLIALNTFGAACVAIVAFISAWRTFRQGAPKRFFHGNVWLAAGIVVISSAGGSARLGFPQLFWVAMLVGWAITFVGYQLLTPRAETIPL
jgi:hypothetical protein